MVKSYQLLVLILPLLQGGRSILLVAPFLVWGMMETLFWILTQGGTLRLGIGQVLYGVLHRELFWDNFIV